MADNLFVKAALAYAGRGWHVFPCYTVRDGRCSCGKLGCDRQGKHPRTKNGLSDATTDPAILRKWFTEYDSGNIAMRTGRESGVVVVDIDGEAGAESFYAWESEHGALPATVEQITGSGGRQLLFRHPGPDVKTTRNVFGPGSLVDSRGDGGYVVLPPSWHRSGRRYEWEASGHPNSVVIAELPSALLEVVNAGPPRTAGVGLPDVIYDGEGREDALVRLAGRMRRDGLNEAEIFAGLGAFNEGRIRPPKSKADLERIARSVSRYSPDPDRAWQERQLAKAKPARQKETTAQGPEPAHDRGERTETDIGSLVEPYAMWAARADAEVPALIPGVLHSSALAIMASIPKTGKTWLLYELILSILSGRPFLGRYPVENTGQVLLIASEGVHADSRARIRALALGKGLDADRLEGLDIIWRRGVLLDDPSFAAWLKSQASRYVLIGVDVLSDSWTGDEDKATQVRPLLRLLRAVSDVGPTVLLNHHNRKPTPETNGRPDTNGRPGLNMRGSIAFYGAYDDGISLEPTKDRNKTLVRLETRAGAPVDPFAFAWPLHTVDGSEACTLDWSEPAEQLEALGALQAKVLAMLEIEPGANLTAVRNRVQGDHKAVDGALNALVGAGLVRKVETTGRDEKGHVRKGLGYMVVKTAEEVADF